MRSRRLRRPAGGSGYWGEYMRALLLRKACRARRWPALAQLETRLEPIQSGNSIRAIRLVATAGILAAVGGLVLACSWSGSKDTGLSKRVVEYGQPVPKGGGHHKVGKPYLIGGRRYYPKVDRRYDKVGIASWYGELFHGRYTANGEIYDMDRLSAAHPTLPMPVYAQVINLENGRWMVVRINDRGPYAHNRIIDLSRKSATLLGFKRKGTARVRVRYLGPAPLNGDDSYERRMLAGQRRHWAAGKPSKNIVLARHGQADQIVTGSTAPAAERIARASSRIPKEPALGSKRFFVQVATFRVRANAERMKERLDKYDGVRIFPVEGRKETYFRVRIGPISARADAESILADVDEMGLSGARIVALPFRQARN